MHIQKTPVGPKRSRTSAEAQASTTMPPLVSEYSRLKPTAELSWVVLCFTPAYTAACSAPAPAAMPVSPSHAHPSAQGRCGERVRAPRPTSVANSEYVVARRTPTRSVSPPSTTENSDIIPVKYDTL